MTDTAPVMKATLAKLRHFLRGPHGSSASPDAAPLEGRRLRALYFIVQYPTFSETYMHEEIRSLRDQYDIKIITYRVTEYPRRDPFPYQVIEYGESCLVYGPIEKVNQDFSSRKQKAFLKKVDAVIEEFAPDVMHAHYFGMALLLRKLAERYHLPFTLRTHSMDMLSEPPEKIKALCDAANSPWCRRVLAFPAFRSWLVDRGLHADKVASCWPVINFARFYQPERRPRAGRVLCAGPAIQKKAHKDLVDLAVLMHGSGLSFDLYAKGHELESTRDHNERAGTVVRITYADPDDMPKVYPEYDWLVYPASAQINKVGLPTAIAEAQASGLGVCWQELPGRREEQLEFLGGGGFLFRSVDELPAIISEPYPEPMRLRGLENARKCDIEGHKALLTEAWGQAARLRQKA
jgi:glycosyltransferase involved in cell wall biosynthesis